MRFWKWAAIILLLFWGADSALARKGSNLTPGKAAVNLGSQTIFFSSQNLINLFNASSQGFESGATPAALDQYGYPVRNFSGNIVGQSGPQSGLISTGPWIFGWDAGRGHFELEFFGQNATFTNVPACVTPTGGGNPVLQGNCSTAGTVTVNFTSQPGFLYKFHGSYGSWNLNTGGRIYMVLQKNLALWNAGQYWTPEYVGTLRGLRVEAIRNVGNAVNSDDGPGSNTVNWNYVKDITTFAWGNNNDYPPGTRSGGSPGTSCPTGGGTVGFCTMAVSNGQVSADPANDTSLAGWVDGEQLTGVLGATVAANLVITNVTGSLTPTTGNCKITVASTTGITNGMTVTLFGIGGATECSTPSAIVSNVNSGAGTFEVNVAKNTNTYTSGGLVGYQHLTITGKSGGSKLIWSIVAAPLQRTDLYLSGNLVTFTYNATLDAVLLTDGGVNNGPPVAAEVNLANLVGANYWYNVPPWANDNYITNAANVIYRNLATSYKPIFEYANECWNFGQDCAHWATRMGAALGLTPFSAGGPLEYQSLRIRLIFGNILPNSLWGNSTRMERSYCIQTAGDTSNYGFYMSGSALVTPGSSSYQAYVTPYIANPGVTGFGFNTTVASGGNGRPIDFTQSMCIAPYTGGGTAFSGQSPDTFIAPSSYDLPLLNSVISYMNSGNVNAAVSLIDQSIRGDTLALTQTVTASGSPSTFTTPSPHGFNQFDAVRFTVAGGTSYSNLNSHLTSTFIVTTVPTGSTFTVAEMVNGARAGANYSAGSAGSGTTSVGLVSSVNSIGSGSEPFISANTFSIMNNFIKWQNFVATFFSPPAAGGTLNVRWYEGNLEPTEPSSAQCTSLSISAADCTTLSTAMEAWRNYPLASATTQYYLKAFMGTQTGTITFGNMLNATAAAWLVVEGGGTYGLLFGYQLGPSGPAQPRQTYFGVRQFSFP